MSVAAELILPGRQYGIFRMTASVQIVCEIRPAFMSSCLADGRVSQEGPQSQERRISMVDSTFDDFRPDRSETPRGQCVESDELLKVLVPPGAMRHRQHVQR